MKRREVSLHGSRASLAYCELDATSSAIGLRQVFQPFTRRRDSCFRRSGLATATARESYISAITMAGLIFVFPFRLRSAAEKRPTLTFFLTSPFLLRRT